MCAQKSFHFLQLNLPAFSFSLHNNSCQLILSHLTCAHGRDKMSKKASDMNGTLSCLLCGDAKKSDYLGLGEVTSHVQAHPLCIKFAKEIHNKKSIVAVGKTRLQVFFHKIHSRFSI